MNLKAPFPWFGGKRRIAHEILAALGPVDNYIEPFAGSLAALLARPDDRWQTGAETVNDADAYLCNFWRALKSDPEAVASFADWPVNECVPAGTMIATPSGDIPVECIREGMVVFGFDAGRIVRTRVMATRASETSTPLVQVGPLALTGNHPVWTPNGYMRADTLTGGVKLGMLLDYWGVERGERVTSNPKRLPMCGEPLAVYNFQTTTGNYFANHLLVHNCDLFARHMWLVNTGRERIAKLESDPDFFDAKVAGWWVWGINAWIGSGWCAGNGPWRVMDGIPTLTDSSGGQWRKRPHLGNAGRGINRKLPHLGDAGRGILEYFAALADRLRRVRVCCGDWSRVVTNGAMAYGDTVGIFLDPPYLGDVRTKDLYRVDNHDIANEVREWALANGDNPRLRIVLAGYEAEHIAAIPDSWRVIEWTGNKSYGTKAAVGSETGNDANRHNERLWLSPGCLTPDQGVLFGANSMEAT